MIALKKNNNQSRMCYFDKTFCKYEKFKSVIMPDKRRSRKTQNSHSYSLVPAYKENVMKYESNPFLPPTPSIGVCAINNGVSVTYLTLT